MSNRAGHDTFTRTSASSQASNQMRKRNTGIETNTVPSTLAAGDGGQFWNAKRTVNKT